MLSALSCGSRLNLTDIPVTCGCLGSDGVNREADACTKTCEC